MTIENEMTEEERRLSRHRFNGHGKARIDGVWKCRCGADMDIFQEGASASLGRLERALRMHRVELARAVIARQAPNSVISHPVYDPSTPCLQAPGKRSDRGYGQIRRSIPKGHLVYSHRVAYEQAYGRIPAGMQVDHVCHNEDPDCAGGPSCLHRGCIQPTHLRLATNRENGLAGKSFAAKNARKTHCDKGHEFTSENIYLQYINTHGRQCRICRRAAWQRKDQRRREQRIALATNGCAS